MIVAVGIDACEVSRVRKALERHGERFFLKICSPRELEACGDGDRALYLAGRFALKEAFSKVLDGAHGVRWHDVEVIRLASGRPALQLHDTAVTRSTEFGIDTWHVSLSHDGGMAVAVAIGEQRRPADPVSP